MQPQQQSCKAAKQQSGSRLRLELVTHTGGWGGLRAQPKVSRQGADQGRVQVSARRSKARPGKGTEYFHNKSAFSSSNWPTDELLKTTAAAAFVAAASARNIWSNVAI